MQPNRIVRRTRVAVGVACASTLLMLVACSPGTADSNEKSLTVSVVGGSVEAAWTKYVIEPFEKKYNVKVNTVPSLTYDTLAKLRAQKGNPQLDVWTMDQPAGVIAVSSDTVEPLSEKNVPNLKDVSKRYPGDPYASLWTGTVGIVYNTERVENPPKTWGDLGDARFKGRVAPPNNLSSAGYSWLLSLAYANGGNTKNVEPGFVEIEKLKPNVLTFWNTQDQMAKLITTGDAWVGVWTYSRASAAIADGAPIAMVCPPEGLMLSSSVIGISKGTKRSDLAQKYINFALDPSVQAEFGNATRLIPSNSKAHLSESVGKYMPSQECMSRSIYPDYDVMAQQTTEWAAEWSKRVTG